jgi:hypothetical protein
MTVTKLDAAKSQLATAIRLYFEDCDPVSVHTLVMAASEIIDRLCQSKGAPTLRNDLFLAPVLPEQRRKEMADALDKARNFFKHASSSKPNQVLRDFSDEQNLIGIIMAAEGLGLLGVEMPETRAFTAWIHVVEPKLAPPHEKVKLLAAASFADLHNQPRAVQKETGRALLLIARRDFAAVSAPSPRENGVT